MYGVLQPLTVTRSEVQREDGTFYTEYELIAGERRLRASKLAGVAQVPVIIREGEQNEQEKLELAIIENLQREDLNAIDRALAFQQLAEQFDLSHTQVAQKVQRSREYVSNSIRLLALPEHIRTALQRGELGEGHARTLLMLNDKPEEQETIFREILLKKMSVREVERIVRKIASDKVRKKQHSDIGDHLIEIEKEFTETLGTRVQIQKTEFGGKLTIDYFSEDDLSAILKRMQAEQAGGSQGAAAAMTAVAAATPLMQKEDVQPVIEPELPAAATDTHQDAPVAAPSQTTQQHATPTDAPRVSQYSVGSVDAPDAPQPQPEPMPWQASPAAVPAPTQPAEPPENGVQSEEPVQQPSTAPTADPSLLDRLAAHTSFGFSRPDPAPEHTVPPIDRTPEYPSQSTSSLASNDSVPVVDRVPENHPQVQRSPESAVDATAKAEPYQQYSQSQNQYKTPESTPASTDETEPTTSASEPEPVNQTDESEDIYSVRNFSI